MELKGLEKIRKFHQEEYLLEELSSEWYYYATFGNFPERRNYCGMPIEEFEKKIKEPVEKIAKKWGVFVSYTQSQDGIQFFDLKEERDRADAEGMCSTAKNKFRETRKKAYSFCGWDVKYPMPFVKLMEACKKYLKEENSVQYYDLRIEMDCDKKKPKQILKYGWVKSKGGEKCLKRKRRLRKK